MDCPKCGQPVLVQDGAITPHLDPNTLTPCDGKAKAEAEPKSAEPEAEAKPAAKAPAKKSAPRKTTSK